MPSTRAREILQSALSKLFSGKLPDKQERIIAAKAHIAYFAWIYLRGDDGSLIKPAPFHLEWYRVFMAQLYGELRHACIMAPKSHAKSTIFSKVAPLYLTCVIDPNLRLINGAVNASLAERILRANRRELEKNELLIGDFGPFRPERPEKWTQTELIVRRTSTSPSPTWRAVGTGETVQGGRSDWIFGDDIADLENSMTQHQRDKLEMWFDSDLLGTLEPEGHVIVIGTAKHNDDLCARLEKKSKAPGSGWYFRRYDAIVDGEKQIALWPARWTWDALMKKKVDIGTVAFNRDMRNIAVNDETAIFKLALLNAAKCEDLVFEEFYGGDEGEKDAVSAGIDLAIVEDERQAQANDSDWTVITVWRRLANGKRRLLWAERRRGYEFTPQVRLAESTLRRYPTLKVATVEANQAQRWFASQLAIAGTGDLPIRKHVTGKGVRVDLYEGIPSLLTLFENNMIELPYGDERSRTFVDIFVSELHGLGVETHDDTVLSFWLNEIGLKKLSYGFSFGKVTSRA